MALKEEQIKLRDTKGFRVEDTFTNLKENYFQPLIEEEKKIVEEYEKALFGKVGCGGAFSYGCLIPVALGFVISSVLPSFYANPYVRTVVNALIITLAEYFLIVWYNNSEFEDKHKKASPFYVRIIKDLLLPFTGVISQDMKDDSKITLVTNLTEIATNTNKLTNKQIEEKGITKKRGLSVYESDIMDLTATMADGTRVNYNLHQILNEVYIYKKRGSKHKAKGKITLKAIFVVPTKTYSPLPEGQIKIGDYTAVVNSGEKNQKIVIKDVVETTRLEEALIREKAVDMMAAVYSVLG